MWTKGEIETTLNLGDLGEGISVTVKFNYSPSTPDVQYTSGGDPCEPGDPEQIELTELVVFGRKIDVIKLTEDAYERICDQISEMEHD